jgi:membrane-bound lytic murein transglycosylase A
MRGGTADREKENLSPTVEEVVAALLPGAAASPSGSAHKKAQAIGKPAPARHTTAQRTAPAQSSAANDLRPPWPAAISSDPSYVFFREIPDSPDGPIGTLGIPLTAGRSLAVDPRTTPLGFPVFVAATQPEKKSTLNRLMLAQDTGGAIRGAVRADYFWGFGVAARSQANRMKENVRMWLLLPKGQRIRALESPLRTRSLGGGGSAGSEAECVVPDPDLCVEDQ